MKTKPSIMTETEYQQIRAECEEEIAYIKSLRGDERDDYVFNMWKEQEARGLLDD